MGPNPIDLNGRFASGEDEAAEREKLLSRFEDMFGVGVRGHYTTTRAVLPLILKSTSGLIVHTATGFARERSFRW